MKNYLCHMIWDMINMRIHEEIRRGVIRYDEELPGSSWQAIWEYMTRYEEIWGVMIASPVSSWQACPARGWGSARPPPSCSTSHLKMQSNVSQEIQRDFRSHKSIAATLTNPFSKILTKPGVRRLFHTLLPLPLLLDELSAPNSLSMFQAKGCERTNDFIWNKTFTAITKISFLLCHKNDAQF